MKNLDPICRNPATKSKPMYGWGGRIQMVDMPISCGTCDLCNARNVQTPRPNAPTRPPVIEKIQ